MLIFGVDISSSAHIDNTKKDILGLGIGPTQGNFTVTNIKFRFSSHCNGANSYLFVNGAEIHKFKAKDSEIVTTSLCLGNISKD